jgi:hypothetical protein
MDAVVPSKVDPSAASTCRNRSVEKRALSLGIKEGLARLKDAALFSMHGDIAPTTIRSRNETAT